MAGKKITYLFGAGASYNAVPILNKLSDAMIKSGEYLAGRRDELYGGLRQPGDNKRFNNFKKFGSDLQILGLKAKEYGTLDTYAKKLYLNSEVEDLKKLKLIVSIFFSLWQQYLHAMFPLSNETDQNEMISFQKIDSRYKSLISNFLTHPTKDGLPQIDENISFLTWNYDHQLESALSLFTKEGIGLEKLNLNYSFLPLANDFSNLKINHLNGVSNFWVNETTKIDLKLFIDESSTNIQDAVRKIGEIHDEDVFHDLSTFIRYSWDGDTEKIYHISNVLRGTDILVIIGYSFPTFNREVDSKLLSGSDNTFDKIIYQDPNASEEILKLFHINLRNKRKDENGKPLDLNILKEIDQFYIPPEYFPQGEARSQYVMPISTGTRGNNNNKRY